MSTGAQRIYYPLGATDLPPEIEVRMEPYRILNIGPRGLTATTRLRRVVYRRIVSGTRNIEGEIQLAYRYQKEGVL